MVTKIRSDETSSCAAAGEIHPALPKLRDQLQSRGRHGEPLHREPQRRRSRETLERIWEASRVAASPKRLNHEWTRIDTNPQIGRREIWAIAPTYLAHFCWTAGKPSSVGVA